MGRFGGLLECDYAKSSKMHDCPPVIGLQGRVDDPFPLIWNGREDDGVVDFEMMKNEKGSGSVAEIGESVVGKTDEEKIRVEEKAEESEKGKAEESEKEKAEESKKDNLEENEEKKAEESEEEKVEEKIEVMMEKIEVMHDCP